MKHRSSFILSFLFILCSCSGFMDPDPNGGYTTEDIWEYPSMVQGLIVQCYDYMSGNYDNAEGALLDGATDNGVITNTSNTINRFATGALQTSSDPFLTFWTRDYNGLYLANLFLKDRKGYNTRYMVDEYKNNLVKTRLQGEAFALRAWFHWDLLQKFGGRSSSGELLGIPLLLDPVKLEDAGNMSRNSYDDCVRQILRDCDSAYYYLPIAHRDFLVKNETDKAHSGSRYWGRMDGITMIALKANVYLTWASPRFNPGNLTERWDSAAVNAKRVMDFKLTVDNVKNGFTIKAGVNWFNPNFPGIVFSSRYTNSSDVMERMFYPGGFQGNGNMGATQDLVDAFPMKNGYPKEHPLGAALYDPQDPYTNRDPRFYSMIFYNNEPLKKNETGAVMYTFETWENGKDAPGPIDNSRTGYYIKKFVFTGLNWSDNSPNKQPHSRFFIRWAHMCLAFAEAANHVVGPTDAARYGLSAKEAISYLRSRDTYNGNAGFTSDPYLDEIAAEGQGPFGEFVKNERRIETCFEGMRFFDLRRWTTSLDELNKPVHKATITRNDDGSFRYDLTQVVESRVFYSAFLPIPYQEMLRVDNLEQNEGWDSWK